ncbi:Uu.00g078610.m01.CDS01 [Anthostomella pinea]|uniref:Uu.00g078610.m01.CDS01 n=1 Tax=Anthostomella pinea TaxID=933095 RepID=A0AAI8YJ52_9PEZI|nr:Uu.00g078610.m01.CDS01 [Anthostomella pinea]
MPHRVVDFFRSPNDHIKASVQRRSSPNTSRRTSRERPTRNPSYASSVDETTAEDNVLNNTPAQTAAPAVKMPDSAKEKHPKDHKDHHRLSFPTLHLGGSKASKDHSYNQSASLDWKIESPPAVMHGDTENSTGALVSGQMLLCVKEPLDVQSFDARLEIHVIQKKPFNYHCHGCAHQKTEVKKWSFLTEPTALSKRTHQFPFSVLLDGHLPASTDNSVLSIQYDFTAEVKPKSGCAIKLYKKIDVKRSLPVPEIPHHSVRIFPPTNITASVHYDQVVHPMGANQFTIRFDGITKRNVEAKSVEYWKLKRLSWKLEENLTTVAPACEKHSPKDAETGQPAKKGAKRTELRTLAHADMHNGWKADYSPDGNIEMEVSYQCPPTAKAVCDMHSSDGTEVTHQLVVEMVVVQEYSPLNQPRHATPTGVARILRMHFGIVMTERAGLGVSWDNEAPPIYQDVPPSPPGYTNPISYDSMEGLVLENSTPNRGSQEVVGEMERGASPAYEARSP